MLNRKSLKTYFLKNAEKLFILIILVTMTAFHLLFQFNVTLLNFYYIPIMIAGYLLGKRLAILYAFFVVLMVWVFILANKTAFLTIKGQFELNIDLTLWGGFLILAGWAGSLSENLKEELRKTNLLRQELALDKESLKDLNDKLNRANLKLEEKVVKRTEELERSHEELKKLSWTDPLTNLLNRRSCEEKFQSEIARFNRTTETFCIILCDIDHFKSINDQHGHDMGDRILVQAAKIFDSITRKTDLVFRWGGEEFLLILTATDLNGGMLVGEKIRAKFEEATFGNDQYNLHVTLSLGVSQYKEGQNMDESVKEADKNLYLAKKAGRNLVFPALQES